MKTSQGYASSWNPDVAGPLDRCVRCWTSIMQDVAYCPTCGHVSPSFNSLPLEHGERCFVHNDRAAEWTCCLCQRPICRECCARETNPLTTFGPLWHCRECINAAKMKEAKFFETLGTKKCCAKHRDVAMEFCCKTCGIPLCRSCTYFGAKGIFKRRPGAGPYCLGYFRTATIGRKRNRWFSGHDIVPPSSTPASSSAISDWLVRVQLSCPEPSVRREVPMVESFGDRLRQFLSHEEEVPLTLLV